MRYTDTKTLTSWQPYNSIWLGLGLNKSQPVLPMPSSRPFLIKRRSIHVRRSSIRSTRLTSHSSLLSFIIINTHSLDSEYCQISKLPLFQQLLFALLQYVSIH